MSQPAIRVKNLSKQYQLGSREEGYKTFRETVMDLATAPVRRFRHLSGTSRKAERFWALKDVSFEVKPGEVVGVIGRNGAGKTTLLKILTRITEPTTGQAEVHGHVGSLLEVGTGFHPELTGRENVFLNGAVLGMPRSVIKRRFDEIVAFSGVEKFLDTPVKRYSSGMQVRLAFAVAAHLDPEILMIDEVLAVGDAEFQKKCLGKMSEVAKGGRTVLFVSHNMGAVQNLCSRAIVLRGGTIALDGAVDETVDAYLGSVFQSQGSCAELSQHPGRPHSMEPIIRSIRFISAGRNGSRPVVTTGKDAVFEIRYDTGGDAVTLVQLGISNLLGQRVTTVGTHLSRKTNISLRGRGSITCRLPSVRLAGGQYSITVMMGRANPPMNLDCVENALDFTVEEGDFFGTGRNLLPQQGHFVQESQWQTTQ